MTTIRRLPSEVPLGPTDGLPKECVASADHTQLVETAELAELVTVLSPAKMRAICPALTVATGSP